MCAVVLLVSSSVMVRVTVKSHSSPPPGGSSCTPTMNEIPSKAEFEEVDSVTVAKSAEEWNHCEPYYYVVGNSNNV